MNNQKQICKTVWQDIAIEVAYTPDWLNQANKYPEAGYAHIEVRSIEPEKIPLPITETGYKSEFIHDSCIDGLDDAVAFIIDQLEEGAKAPVWQAYVEQQRQYTLF